MIVTTRIENGKTVEDRYVLSDSNLYTYYQMRVFDWEKYLNSFSSLPKSNVEERNYSSPNDFELICSVKREDEKSYKRYYQNSYSLDKGIDLRFELRNYASMPIRNIKWKVVNFGTEAEQSESGLEFYMERYEGEHFCEQSTAYTGLHYMECYIYNYDSKLIAKDRFGLFINDEIRNFRRLGVAESE